MANVKAIETYYNGYRFRSRLEARWAVFFDTANIKYEYEPEGYEVLSREQYLPDFYLPEERFFVEVKPPREGAYNELHKVIEFVRESHTCVLVLGNIPGKDDAGVFWFPCLYYHPVIQDVEFCRVTFLAEWWEGEGVKNLYVAKTFYPARKSEPYIMLNREGYLEAVPDKKIWTNGCLSDAIDDESRNYLVKCWDKARQARFEYGENG